MKLFALSLAAYGSALDFDDVDFANANRAAIAARVNGDPSSSWVAATTGAQLGRFANTSYSVLRSLAGVLGGDPTENEAGLPTRTLAETSAAYAARFGGGSSLPVSFDAARYWSAQCGSIIAEIRDQSACGSCYAVSAASVASDRFCIAHNGTRSARLSGVDLMSCCKTCAGSNGGCFGGTPSKCWDYISTQGIATGAAHGDKSACLEYPFAECAHHDPASPLPACPDTPYNAPTCFWACDSGPGANTGKHTYDGDQAAHKFATSYKVAAKAAAIQGEIATHGPVQASMFLTADFEVYRSGVFTTTSTDYVGAHAVRIVGWGTDAGAGKDYWKVANSWNDGWGEAGYFRIERGANILQIEAGVVAGTVHARK